MTSTKTAGYIEIQPHISQAANSKCDSVAQRFCRDAIDGLTGPDSLVAASIESAASTRIADLLIGWLASELEGETGFDEGNSPQNFLMINTQMTWLD